MSVTFDPNSQFDSLDERGQTINRAAAGFGGGMAADAGNASISNVSGGSTSSNTVHHHPPSSGSSELRPQRIGRGVGRDGHRLVVQLVDFAVRRVEAVLVEVEVDSLLADGRKGRGGLCLRRRGRYLRRLCGPLLWRREGPLDWLGLVHGAVMANSGGSDVDND